ncbi:G-protein coupled receptor 143 [Asbolus verrucosus]|uniref:G-protein coupled receptor 143 n=1 Tax=Asbolus verrucosus TaxID=1661398 RepID=A0A482V9K3_ASBVE|nr:G-protein coupled receptor 143 [Asbolus verrucosus]
MADPTIQTFCCHHGNGTDMAVTVMQEFNTDAYNGALIQYFYTATWIWTLIYAIDMRFILSEQASKTKYYHLAAWILPAILTTTGLSLLYLPDANCHTSVSLTTAVLRILPNYIATYIPIATVMVANPCLYHHSSRDMEYIITSASGQFTSREREILDAIKIKFSALMNPLQALFNCMVYRRWRNGSEKIILPWRKVEGSFPTVHSQHSHDSFNSSVREEIVPLLQNAQSVNGYRNYW